MLSYGERMRELRTVKGMTQEQLSWAAGVSQQMIAKYEDGGKTPSLQTAQLIAEALGTTVDFMVKGDEKK